MKFKYLALIFSVLTASPVLAAPVVMVQFGSFETQAEAQKRLSDLAASNPSVFSTLNASVREVKLPPDNLTVFRTQAGPLDSRAAAQSLCNRLAGNGSECYVVETASAPASTPVVAAAPKLPETAPIVVPAPAADTKAATDVQDALTKAAAAQNSGMLSAPVTKAAEAEKPSFWSRLNPFSSTPAPKPVVVAKPVEEKLPTAAPVMEVASAPVAPIPSAKVEAPKLEALPLSTAAPAVLAPKAEEPKLMAAAPVVQTSPMISRPAVSRAPISLNGNGLQPRLLPPPAPLTEKDKKILEETAAIRSSAASAPSAVSIPVVDTPQVALTPSTGSVRVEEAKRVPVTQATDTAKPSVLIPPAVSTLPSSTLGQKTLWAQVGSFANSEDALVFWDQYRRAHPDFPALRVRVVSSLQAQMRGNDTVWLRVGPFSRDAFIDSLCSSMKTSEATKAKRCGRVTDMGVAMRSGITQVSSLQGSRYKR